MNPFEYPPARSRRHGPRGYADYSSYRPWLRDEFDFRCVFCLAREQWGRVLANFSVDRFLPAARYPSRRGLYDNLLYTCSACNEAKLDQVIPDPLQVLTRGSVMVYPDGTISGLTDVAKELIRSVDLDGVDATRFRANWIGILGAIENARPRLFRQLMAYPDDLPDLAALRPPGGNTRPAGLAQSHHARRGRGELPAAY